MSAEIITAICAGLATAVPLIIKLVEYVQRVAKEKNWSILVGLIMKLMIDAEENLDLADGASKKAWVIEATKAASTTINYDVDVEAVSLLIDNLSSLTKQLNNDGKVIIELDETVAGEISEESIMAIGEKISATIADSTDID